MIRTYVYMYIYMHAGTAHVCMHSYLDMYKCEHTYIYMCYVYVIYMYICILYIVICICILWATTRAKRAGDVATTHGVMQALRTCVSIRIYICINVNIYAYVIHIYICYIYICVMYICIYVYMNIYMFMCIDSDDTPRALLGVVMAACCDVKALHMCVYVCLNVFICMHVYIYTCTHTHTHTHTHTRIARWKRWS